MRIPRPYRNRCRAGRLDKLHLRHLGLVEISDPLASKFLQLFEASLALPYESGYVYTQSNRLKLLEASGAVAQQTRGPAPVTILQVVEADADLENTLVEKSDPPWLLHPGFLEVLVTLVELALVKLLDSSLDELGDLLGRRFSRSSPRRSSRVRPPCAWAPWRCCWRGRRHRG
jgi:hypothetical protein